MFASSCWRDQYLTLCEGNEWENWTFVFLAYLGAVDATMGIECREAIDKKEPATLAGMADDDKVRAATVYNMLAQVLQKRVGSLWSWPPPPTSAGSRAEHGACRAPPSRWSRPDQRCTWPTLLRRRLSMKHGRVLPHTGGMRVGQP